MKHLSILLVFLTFIAITAKAQTSDVTYLPGLGESSTVWSNMSNELLQQYNYNEQLSSYNDAVAIQTAANNLYISYGDVVIAHSKGGLVAREYLRQHSPTNFKALITVGTPNKGAPIVTNALNGNAANVIGDWVHDLAIGPLVSLQTVTPWYIDIAAYFGLLKLTGATTNTLQGFIDAHYANNAGVTDMEPSSTFMNTLNSNPDNTLPPARYAIYGAEQIHTAWHLLGSVVAGPGSVENKAGINAHNYLESFYGAVAYYAGGQKVIYYWLMKRAKENYDIFNFLHYRKKYFLWRAIAEAWQIGYDSLHFKQQRQWSTYVTGARDFNSSTPYREDGILSQDTQAPAFFNTADLVNRRLIAKKVNHIEETAHPNVKEKLSQIFQNPDVNIGDAEVPDDSPLSINIFGNPYTYSGQIAAFNTYVANAEGPVSYQWYFRNDTGSPWVSSGGNTSSYQHIFYTPSGQTKNAAVKVEITSAGDTASEIYPITVLTCQNMANGVNLFLPPCN